MPSDCRTLASRPSSRKSFPPLRPHSGTACIANVFGYEIRDYVAVIEALNHAPGIAAYELNASCPNTQHGGMVFGTDTGILDQLVTRAKAVSKRPLIVKLSPNVTSIAQMAKCAENAGADALSPGQHVLIPLHRRRDPAPAHCQ